MARRVMMTRCGALSTPAGPHIVASIAYEATSDNCPARRCSAKVKWHIGTTDLKCARRATNHICSVDARISTCDISIPQRPEELRVGEECVSTCKYRRSPFP